MSISAHETSILPTPHSSYGWGGVNLLKMFFFQDLYKMSRAIQTSHVYHPSIPLRVGSM